MHPRNDEPLTDFIGAPVVLSIVDRTGMPRLVHGLVNEMSRLHRGNHLTHYQCSIVPIFWFLDKNGDHRIFQNKSVQQIITHILQEQGFASETFAFKCFTTYSQREYCVHQRCFPRVPSRAGCERQGHVPGWIFLTPLVMLESSANEPDFAKTPVAPGIDYDTYRSPYL